MKNQNVSQFSIPVKVMSEETMNDDGTFLVLKDRFKLSLSDCGQDRGFEAMLIDFDSKSSDAKHKTIDNIKNNDGKFVRFIDLSDIRVCDIDGLEDVMNHAKAKVGEIIEEEFFKKNLTIWKVCIGK